jgi:hypothetical protein
MSTINEALRARIVALGTAAADRVFNEIIEQEPTMPAIGFVRTGTPEMGRAVDTGRRVLETATFRIEIIADSTASADAVGAALYAGLDGWRGTSAGVEVLRCVRTFEGAGSVQDGDLFLKIVQQDYELTFR